MFSRALISKLGLIIALDLDSFICYNVIMTDLFSYCRIYFIAAALGAHSNFLQQGFRQKDVRFLIGLFLNWMDASTKGVDEKIHNTQISRFLDQLLKDGYATKSGRGSVPRYQLTRAGLLELVGQLVHAPVPAPFEQFFFVFYFVKTYGSRLTELVAQKENRLPRSLQVELQSLLDLKEILDQQIRFVQLEIRKLEERMKETKGAAQLASQLSTKGASADEMIRSVEQLFPYEMNSQKKMSDLFREIPPALRIWELTTGNTNRYEILWASQKESLEGYFKVLTQMKTKL